MEPRQKKECQMSKLRGRDAILAVIIALGFVIHQIGTDLSKLTTSEHAFLAILGLVVALGAVLTMVYDHTVTRPIEIVGATEVPQPAISRFLFHDTRSAPLWLALRLYVGIAWFTAGFEKITGSPSWLSNGNALKGYWTDAASIPKTGKTALSYDW